MPPRTPCRSCGRWASCRSAAGSSNPPAPCCSSRRPPCVARRVVAAVARPGKRQLAGWVLARLPLASGDGRAARALLERVGIALGRRLGLSERARRTAATVYVALGLPVPGLLPHPDQS